MRMSPMLIGITTLSIAGCSAIKSTDTDPPPTFVETACAANDNDADCSILVDVSMNADGTCSVEVLKSQYTVGFKRGAKNKWVQWSLTSSSPRDFRFASKGIDPKTSPADNVAKWNANFKNGGASQGGRQFNWKNGNDPQQAGTVYVYMVNVELPRPPGAPLTCKQDPFIKN